MRASITKLQCGLRSSQENYKSELTHRFGISDILKKYPLNWECKFLEKFHTRDPKITVILLHNPRT